MYDLVSPFEMICRNFSCEYEVLLNGFPKFRALFILGVIEFLWFGFSFRNELWNFRGESEVLLKLIFEFWSFVLDVIEFI